MYSFLKHDAILINVHNAGLQNTTNFLNIFIWSKKPLLSNPDLDLNLSQGILLFLKGINSHGEIYNINFWKSVYYTSIPFPKWILKNTKLRMGLKLIR